MLLTTIRTIWTGKRGKTMAKKERRLNAQETILHNELIYLDQVVEPNLTQGPYLRVVPWNFIARTTPSADEECEAIRGFPDGH